MSFISDLSQSQEYLSFRSSVPLRKIVVDSGNPKDWRIYDCGPKKVKSPLICLPPVSGTADIFFKQALALSAKGVRVICAESPVYWSVKEWCEGFKKLLDHLELNKVHLFGASLGGYLAQKFAEHTYNCPRVAYIPLRCVPYLKVTIYYLLFKCGYLAQKFAEHTYNCPQVAYIPLRCVPYLKVTIYYLLFKCGYLAQKFAEHTYNCPRVASLILCNAFTDTSVFNNHVSASLFWMMPALALKHMVMGNFASEKVDPEMISAIDFMVERLESLPQAELASRLTLNCVRGYVEAHKLVELPVTIVDVFDKSALCNNVREELYKCYPQAKLAHLKSGGNFPYLSRSVDVNLYLQIHLGHFDGSTLSSSDGPLVNRK